MLGFVSALSSAVAVMILLMSVLLANLLSAAISKDAKLNSSTLNYSSGSGSGSEESKGKPKVVITPGKGFSLSVSDLLPLRSSDSAVRIYCAYGNNMSLEIAKKYTTYNYIVAKSVLGDKKIVVVSPIYEPTSKNNCAVEELKNE
ncbi:hypothetical protein [Salmonella bongori]|uniref:hypothetical protein n=1 Tax=Salmonella bongori TaxID=54736 RepID=UPI0020A6CF87|nr:hypothetical protein [Salmonella bongori]